MIKYNFIRVITFISILVLFFAQSVYDPSVHAKMQRMEDENLSEINAAALDIEMTNLTVRSVVTDLFRLKDGQAPYDSVNIGSMEIGNGTAGTGFTINAMMSWDLGAKDDTGQTWILGTNMFFPYNNRGLGIIANNLYFGDNGTATTLGNYLPIGNSLIVKGISFGQDVTATPSLNASFVSPFTAPWVIISSEGSSNRGLEFYSELAGFVDNVTYYWNNNINDASSLRISGVYIYGMTNEVAGGDSSAWTTRNGAMKLGGSYPTYNVTTGAATGSTDTLYGSIDVGSNATNTKVFISLPTAGSVRVKNFWFGNRNWGPIAIDDLVFYTNKVIFKDLNKL
jgi:hypothetical protein